MPFRRTASTGFEQYAAGAGRRPRLCARSRRHTGGAHIGGIAHSVYRPDPSFDSTPTYARKFTAGIERALDADTTSYASST